MKKGQQLKVSPQLVKLVKNYILHKRKLDCLYQKFLRTWLVCFVSVIYGPPLTQDLRVMFIYSTIKVFHQCFPLIPISLPEAWYNGNGIIGMLQHSVPPVTDIESNQNSTETVLQLLPAIQYILRLLMLMRQLIYSHSISEYTCGSILAFGQH